MAKELINIKAARVQRKITAKQIAQELGVCTAAYYYYEGGDRVPSVDMAIKIAKMLKVPVEDLDWGTRRRNVK